MPPGSQSGSLKARWETARLATSTSALAVWSCRTSCASHNPSARASSSGTLRCVLPAPQRRSRAVRCTSWDSLATAACMRTAITCSPSLPSLSGRAFRGSRFMRCSMGATPAPRRASDSRMTSLQRLPGGQSSPASAAAISAWIETIAGRASSAGIGRQWTAPVRLPPIRSSTSGRHTAAARPTSSSSRRSFCAMARASRRCEKATL